MKFRLFSCIAVLLASSSAHAQIAGTADQAEKNGEEIVVLGSGFEQPADQTGQAIAVIGQDRIARLQAVTVADALGGLPSLSIVRRGPVGTQTSIFVRGGNSSQTLVLLDGVRVNDPSSPNAAFDFGGLLAANVERIEVLRGPNSVIWGSQAMGGVVNIVTSRPSAGLTFSSGGEYGAYDTFSGHAAIAGSSDMLGFSLGGALYRSGGFSVFSGGSERDGSRQAALNGRITLALAPGLELDLRGNFGDARVEYDSAFSGGANSLARAHNRQWFAYAGLNLDLADGRFRQKLAYSRADIDRVGTDPVVFSFNNYLANGVTDRVEYRGAFELSDAVLLVAGLEHERIRASTAYEGAPADRASNQVTGGYLQATLKPLPGLTLTGGVRHDVYSDYGGQTTFGGNLAYSPNGGRTVLRATYAEGFRAPSLSEGQPPYGNPALKPETARNLDLGLEQHLLDNRLSLSAIWYHRRSTDQIVFSFTTFLSANVGRADADGLELALVLRPTDRLRIDTGYGLVNAFDRSISAVGTRLPLRPQHSASVSVDWQTPLGLRLGGSLILVGDSFDNAANTVRLDGYRRLDLRAELPVTDSVQLTARVDNATGEVYSTVAGYASAGRSAFVGARARF